MRRGPLTAEQTAEIFASTERTVVLMQRLGVGRNQVTRVRAGVRVPLPRIPIPERVAARTQPDPVTGCHVWTGNINRHGYGTLVVPGSRRTMVVHRIAFELARGPIPDGLVIDHLCRNRACVNPDHMEAVTVRENTLRGVGAAAMHARQTHCKRGHPLSGSNLKIEKRGQRYAARVCLACRRARQTPAQARQALSTYRGEKS